MFVSHVGLHYPKNDPQNIWMEHTHKLRQRLSTIEVALDKQTSRRHARYSRHAQSCVQKHFFYYQGIIEVVKWLIPTGINHGKENFYETSMCKEIDWISLLR